MKEYKSPIAALLWSITMTGFGQFYNGQYIFGTLLFVLSEVFLNNISNLNASILLSFQGDLKQAHDIFDIQWGLFYPSVFLFSMWQAYNKAIVINYQQDGEDPPKETYLTGFFFSCVIGMNLGTYWQPKFLDQAPILNICISPIFSGLIVGVFFGSIGHLLERYIKKRGRHFF